MEYIIAILYTLALLYIFLFSLSQLHLTWYYKRKHQNRQEQPILDLSNVPLVTVQLPIYNEMYVVERLLEAVANFNYPLDRLEIQVLDDSTDQTTRIIASKIKKLSSKGLDIVHVRRNNREGFKAGALQHGLEIAKGEFLAIFDADFLPEPDFLKQTVPYFQNKEIGMVQTRWGHVNKDYSLLTRLQAFGLDAHFSIEQQGRSNAGSFINFNGTGGVWRRSCIEHAGGWSADTLTEDLDLSYRAQFNGWKFKYLEDVVAPAELPVLMPAVKSQQFRWNKGAAETARKNLKQIATSGWSMTKKSHAFFHLFNSSVFICLLAAAVLSIPMLFIKHANPQINTLFNLGGLFLIGFFSITYFYWTANQQIAGKNSKKYFLKMFPSFLTVSMGLSLHNSVAVMEGFFGFKSPFVRTPKFNIRHSKDSLRKNVYVNRQISCLTWVEGLLSLYFAFGIIAGLYLGDSGLLVFHVMLCLGFAMVFVQSVKTVKYAT
ncbi:MAG: glucosyltransferase [Cyclobacteriaceae bacterium]|nr:MAG: glucosyltransferase [Cyclobacteriaceae bacterium]